MASSDDRKRILCFGDSNTYGFDPVTNGRYDDGHRWPSVLQRQLGDDYDVISEGLNGRTTVFSPPEAPYCCGYDYWIPCLLSHFPLWQLILMLGTNDCSYTDSSENITAGLEKLVTAALRLPVWDDNPAIPRIVLIVPAVIGGTRYLPYKDADFRSYIRRSHELAGRYQELAKQYQLGYFDANTVAEVGTADLLHLSAKGHRKLGIAIAEYVTFSDTGMP